MIDTWLSAGIILGLLSLGVLLRGIPAKSRDDRLVAATAGVTGMATAGLVLGVGLGMLIIADIAIAGSAICFCILFWLAGKPEAGAA